jgi:hypothetical protein
VRDTVVILEAMKMEQHQTVTAGTEICQVKE